MKPGGYNLVMGETRGVDDGQPPDHTIHTVVANPVHSNSIGSMELEADGERVRRPTMAPPRTTCTCDLPECSSRTMTEERWAFAFSAIAVLLSLIALIVVAAKPEAPAASSATDLQVSELSKMVKELATSNQLLANDLALLMASGDDDSTATPLVPNPPGTTTIEVLCQQMESSQTDISTLYQQVGDLQDGMDDLDYRMTTLEGQGGGSDSSGGGGGGDGGASGGYYSGSFNSSAGWLNDFMSVKSMRTTTQAWSLRHRRSQSALLKRRPSPSRSRGRTTGSGL
mmetsp:Transcript_34379/g.91006  ORF Transcript_34379/g.91006 Transcript_34379/m.91006 type:complete len:284 (-) Transcript_34379:631-1482(-)